VSVTYRLTATVESIERAADERFNVKVWFDAPPNEQCWFFLNRPEREAAQFHVGQKVTLDLDFAPTVSAKETT